jgi:hypothetical protein
MIKEFVNSGHFYSIIPDINDKYNSIGSKFLNLDFNEKNHIKILDEINNYLINFDEIFGYNENSNQRQQNFQYSLINDSFGWMDARLLYYFIQKNKPKKIIEIGSGNSTLLIYNINKMFNLNIEITCVDPYPTDYVKNLHNSGEINLINDKLENINLNLFKNLEENDILFIDSSHVVKLDSDVLYYFTNIFPILNKNVIIHIHDIFFPNDYPNEWLIQGRFWNEQYFLYIFLQYNSKFKIQFCNSYSLFKYSEKLKEIQKNSYEIKNNITKDIFGGGSIWLQVQ